MPQYIKMYQNLTQEGIRIPNGFAVTAGAHILATHRLFDLLLIKLLDKLCREISILFFI